VVIQQPQYVEEMYCGPLSWIVGCCIPCGCWVCFCPIDSQMVPVQ